ncbi:hypothetical protein [Stenotrophomonas geniculata]|uniref:hypothetical protein n=1 Tax=Stenotrophomonas geniculata TaxID=86188 RepID=UPI002E763C34|nr:hypothetical protein [Stenotrophomonas geniculata]
MTPKQARAAIHDLVREAETKCAFGRAQLTAALFVASAVFTKSLCKAMGLGPTDGIIPGNDCEGWTYLDHHGEIVFLCAFPDGRFGGPFHGVQVSEGTREAAEEVMFALMGVDFPGQTFAQFQATRETIKYDRDRADPTRILGTGTAHSYMDLDTSTECHIEVLAQGDERGAFGFWMLVEDLHWKDFYFHTLIGAERKAYELTRDPESDAARWTPATGRPSPQRQPNETYPL